MEAPTRPFRRYGWASRESTSMNENTLNDVRETELQNSSSRLSESSHSPVCEGTLSRDEMEHRRMEAAQDFLQRALPFSRSGQVWCQPDYRLALAPCVDGEGAGVAA